MSLLFVFYIVIFVITVRYDQFWSVLVSLWPVVVCCIHCGNWSYRKKVQKKN